MTVTNIDSLGDLDYALRTHQFVVLDCWATFCGPCKKIAPEYAKLALKYPEICFMKAEMQEAADIAYQYQVTQLPTFLFFEAGKEQRQLRLIGADLKVLQERLADLLLKSRPSV